MSRSGYEYDCEGLNLYRGRVTNAIRGKRGQKLLRDALAALDEMPVKRLISNELVTATGEVCLLGAVGKRRGIAGLDKIDMEYVEHSTVAEMFDVAECLTREITFENDEAWYGAAETPEHRFERMRKWLVENIAAPAAMDAERT